MARITIITMAAGCLFIGTWSSVDSFLDAALFFAIFCGVLVIAAIHQADQRRQRVLDEITAEDE